MEETGRTLVQAVPRSLNLAAEKPAAVPAFSRRVESIATNAQNFTENTVSNILIDTSTPGSFLDPTQSLLQFDLTIKNQNPYIDYVNFLTCGANALIQEMRILCQGTPIEEILDYNLCFELWMDLGGHAQDEFKMFMENAWRAPVLPGDTDLNFVKPPMIDREGVIMCPTMINALGDPDYRKENVERGVYIGRSNATTEPTGMLGKFATGVNYTTATTLSTLANTVLGPGTTELTATTQNHSASFCPEDVKQAYSGSLAPGCISTQSWTNRLDNTYVTWPSTIRPEPPGLNPVRTENENRLKKYRVQDYLAWLSNVKNVPVGVAPLKNFIKSDTNWGDVNNAATNVIGNTWNIDKAVNTNDHMAPSNTGQFTTTVSLPIFSGILGVWAEKMFPTMLVAPGSMYLQIRWAKAVTAFQYAMDPCRRVFGTYRDYLPNCGLSTYYKTEQKGQVLLSDRTSTKASAVDNPFMAYTSAAAKGDDYAWRNIYPPFQAGTTAPSNLVSRLSNATANPNYSTAGVMDGTCTGNAKPQYILVDRPWQFGGNGFLGGTWAPVPYRKACFGTYLPRSTAQV